MQTEIWKAIPNYTLYEASNKGRIKTFNWKGSGKEAIMKPAKDGDGYLRTMLKRDSDGKTHTIKVHRIIATTFIPNLENKETVNHINGVKTDNRVENLEWATRKEQAKHAYDNNLNRGCKGVENGSAKLSESDVLEIRRLYKSRKVGKNGKAKKGELTLRDISEMFNISRGTILNIATRKKWNHL